MMLYDGIDIPLEFLQSDSGRIGQLEKGYIQNISWFIPKIFLLTQQNNTLNCMDASHLGIALFRILFFALFFPHTFQAIVGTTDGRLFLISTLFNMDKVVRVIGNVISICGKAFSSLGKESGSLREIPPF